MPPDAASDVGSPPPLDELEVFGSSDSKSDDPGGTSTLSQLTVHVVLGGVFGSSLVPEHATEAADAAHTTAKVTKVLIRPH